MPHEGADSVSPITLGPPVPFPSPAASDHPSPRAPSPSGSLSEATPAPASTSHELSTTPTPLGHDPGPVHDSPRSETRTGAADEPAISLSTPSPASHDTDTPLNKPRRPSRETGLIRRASVLSSRSPRLGASPKTNPTVRENGQEARAAFPPPLQLDRDPPLEVSRSVSGRIASIFRTRTPSLSQEHPLRKQISRESLEGRPSLAATVESPQISTVGPTSDLPSADARPIPRQRPPSSTIESGRAGIVDALKSQRLPSDPQHSREDAAVQNSIRHETPSPRSSAIPTGKPYDAHSQSAYRHPRNAAIGDAESLTSKGLGYSDVQLEAMHNSKAKVDQKIAASRGNHSQSRSPKSKAASQQLSFAPPLPPANQHPDMRNHPRQTTAFSAGRKRQTKMPGSPGSRVPEKAAMRAVSPRPDPTSSTMTLNPRQSRRTRLKKHVARGIDKAKSVPLRMYTTVRHGSKHARLWRHSPGSSNLGGA